MKTNFNVTTRFKGAVILALLLSSCGARKDAESSEGGGLMALNVNRKRPISEVTSSRTAGTYALAHRYAVREIAQIQEGMEMSFSISYGIGGEAGQAYGELVKGKDGDLYFKQKGMTTEQMALAPGRPWTDSGGNGASLWNVTKYLDLINRVSFSAEPASLALAESASASNQPVYTEVSAYEVDFDGGTANKKVSYSDSMELKLVHKTSRSTSNLNVYYAPDVGAVAYEFSEKSENTGTFKAYIGKAKKAPSRPF